MFRRLLVFGGVIALLGAPCPGKGQSNQGDGGPTCPDAVLAFFTQSHCKIKMGGKVIPVSEGIFAESAGPGDTPNFRYPIRTVSDIGYSDEDLKTLPVVDFFVSRSGTFVFQYMAPARGSDGSFWGMLLFEVAIGVTPSCEPHKMVMSFYLPPLMAEIEPFIYKMRNEAGELEEFQAPFQTLQGLKGVSATPDMVGVEEPSEDIGIELVCEKPSEGVLMAKGLGTYMFSEDDIERRLGLLRNRARQYQSEQEGDFRGTGFY